MFANTLQQQRNLSRNCNVRILQDSGFKKVGATSLFKRGDYRCFSPGISVGKHEKYWFDVRMENIKKIVHVDKTFSLLRIVPVHYCAFDWKVIEKHLVSQNSDVRSNSGVIWGFACAVDVSVKNVEIFTKNDTSKSFVAKLLNENETIEELKKRIEI